MLVLPSAPGTHYAKRRTPGPASRSAAGDCELACRPATCACRHSGGDELVPLYGMSRRGPVAPSALEESRKIAEAAVLCSLPDREERTAIPVKLVHPCR